MIAPPETFKEQIVENCAEEVVEMIKNIKQRYIRFLTIEEIRQIIKDNV